MSFVCKHCNLLVPSDKSIYAHNDFYCLKCATEVTYYDLTYQQSINEEGKENEKNEKSEERDEDEKNPVELDDLTKCLLCLELFHYEEMQPDKPYCKSCWPEMTPCSHCKKDVYIEDTEDLFDNLYCQDCFKEQTEYTSCDCCKCVVWKMFIKPIKKPYPFFTCAACYNRMSNYNATLFSLE
jgi:hypothetical protein